jgi:transcriptional regulator with XRE-family HTH domain
MSRVILPRSDNQAGANLRALIDSRWHGSDRSFAEAAGVTAQTLSRLINGATDLRKSPKLEAIARALGVRESDILYGDEERREAERVVVPLDEHGAPVEDELEQLRSWLPDEAVRRLSRHTTPRAWLGMLYTHGIDEGWPKERLDRIDSARRRVDALREAADSEAGAGDGEGG